MSKNAHAHANENGNGHGHDETAADAVAPAEDGSKRKRRHTQAPGELSLLTSINTLRASYAIFEGITFEKNALVAVNQWLTALMHEFVETSRRLVLHSNSKTAVATTVYNAARLLYGHALFSREVVAFARRKTIAYAASRKMKRSVDDPQREKSAPSKVPDNDKAKIKTKAKADAPVADKAKANKSKPAPASPIPAAPASAPTPKKVAAGAPSAPKKPKKIVDAPIAAGAS